MTHRCAYSGEVPGAKAHRDYIMADVTIRERCTEGIAAETRMIVRFPSSIMQAFRLQNYDCNCDATLKGTRRKRVSERKR